MTRPDRRKLAYLLILAAGVACAWLAAQALVPKFGVWAVLLVGLLLLVPSRLQAGLLRQHFRGRRAHMARRFDDAIACYEQQLAALARRPWTSHAVWLGFMFYTTRADAMVWNNIAAAHLDAGRSAEARAAALRALAIDPAYPLPWVNLAGAALRDDDRAEAERALDEARRLGYRGTSIDRLIQTTSAAWARVQAGAAKRG